MLRNRVLVLIGISVFLVFLLLSRLFLLQIIQGDFWEHQALISRFRSDPIPFHRGTIFDRDGKVLAGDVDVYGIDFHYRAFRRGNPIAQAAHVLTIAGDRRISLMEVAADPAWAMRELAKISVLDLWNLPDPQSRSDARFYLARLLDLKRLEADRLTKLFLGEGLTETPIVHWFSRSPSNVLTKIEKAYDDLATLEKKIGFEKNSLLEWIEAQRTQVESEIATRSKKFTGSPLQIARKKADLQNDWECRKQRVASKLNYDLVHFLTLRQSSYPGFGIDEDTERIYPSDIAAAFVGIVQKPSEADLAKTRDEEKELFELSRIFDRTDEEQSRFDELLRKVPRSAYQQNDLKGRLGLESMYEEQLRGERGSRMLNFEQTAKLNLPWDDIPPVDGKDLVLTISAPLQAIAEKTLREGYGSKRDLAGAIVVLDVHTGEILAMATAPTFTSQSYRENYTELSRDPRHPLHNRVCNPYQAPPPGSVFKLVVAAAALEEKLITPNFTVNCQHAYKGLNCNDGGNGHGPLDMYSALKYSCNVYFYQVGEMLGVDRIADYAEKRFGFGRETGIELKEQAGVINRKLNDPRRFAIGQTLISVTPLQVVKAYAAMANGGKVVVPHLIRSMGMEEYDYAPVGDLGLSAETLEHLKRGMATVTAPGGTAHARDGWDLRDFGVVGKTGTAEVSKGVPDHAWFAGFLPVDAPQVAFCVFVERVGMHGGDLAAPLAYKVLSSEPMKKYIEEAK